MRKKLTKSEAETARKIISIWRALDKSVFPEKPVHVIFPFRMKKVPSGFLSYNKTRDCYTFKASEMDKAIECCKEGRIAFIKFAEKLTHGGFPETTEEELIISKCSHEVRHRVQLLNKIELILPETFGKGSSHYFRSLIQYVRFVFKDEPPKEHYKGEFDARVIEILVGEMWHWGERDLSKIASVIKAGANELKSIIN